MPDNIDVVVLPTLGEDGWVFSNALQADYLMSHFLASDYSQTYVHPGSVSSFGWIVAQYGSEPSRLISEVRRVLAEYLGRYFNNVLVEARDATNPEEPSKFILAIFVEYQTADGIVNNISQLTQINGSKFELINQIINNGDP